MIEKTYSRNEKFSVMKACMSINKDLTLENPSINTCLLTESLCMLTILCFASLNRIFDGQNLLLD